MHILLSGNPQFVKSVHTGTELLTEEIPSSGNENLTLSVTLSYASDNCISITKQGTDCFISCPEPVHYFRALNDILHHANEDFKKHETAFFRKNGFMLDCSRNFVPSADTVKSFIRILAKMGMNQLFLYMEDTYEVPGLPYFGAYRGRYSKEELKELDAYAAVFGIELIPCIQTLAHLKAALRWPAAASLKDTDDILKVGSPEVYAFLEQLLVSLKECFRTRNIHIGMDEAAMLGLGNYLHEKGYKDSSLLIKEHSRRVLEICRKRGWVPMMWSDMYLTSNTGKGYYSADEHTDTSGWIKPEEDLALVYWDYYHAEEKIYLDMLRVHREIAQRTVFAGGVWTWNGIAPNYGKAFACTVSALRACRKSHIEEVFATGWLDNGAETPLEAVYPGLALFSLLCFREHPDEAELKQYFNDCLDAELDDFYLLDAFDSLFQGTGQNLTTDNPSKFLLYQDTMLGMFDYHIQNTDTQTYYENLVKKLESAADSSPKYRDFFRFYKYFALVLSRKADLGIRIKKAYDTKDLSTLTHICEKVIPTLLENLRKMHSVREKLWMQNAKPFGYELLDIRLGGVCTRLESHKRRIESYLNGNISSLEELEQERLPYWQEKNHYPHGSNVELRLNYWDKIISACCLMDTL